MPIRQLSISGYSRSPAILAIGTGVIFGILPAWQVSRTRPNEALRDTERVVASRWLLRGAEQFCS
jgi:hypothetical protein